MRTTISIDEQILEHLLQVAGTENKTKAVNLAITSFIRQERVARFKKLRGKLDIPSNDELEQEEIARADTLANRGI